jgi:iron complex outermembrane receptor protein
VLRAETQPNRSVDSLVDLSPVIDDNQEVGLDYDDGRWLVHLAMYRSDSDLGSRLDFDRATQTYNVARERTEIKGFDGSLAYQVQDDMRVGVAYARTRGRYDSNKDNRVDSDLPGINVSPDRITAFWELAFTPSVNLRLQASKAEGRDFYTLIPQTSNYSRVSFDGYTTVDLLSRFRLPVGTLSVGVENVFNEQYISYYSQVTPPRNDTYTAGRGRVLTVGWSHRF